MGKKWCKIALKPQKFCQRTYNKKNKWTIHMKINAMDSRHYEKEVS